jgi:hypothetical protein
MLRKVTLEFDNEVLTIDGEEAKKWSAANDMVAGLAWNHGFPYPEIAWVRTPTRAGITPAQADDYLALFTRKVRAALAELDVTTDTNRALHYQQPGIAALAAFLEETEP